jgi:hypothetical protein
MKMSLCTALCAAVLVFTAGAVSADPWKDESGNKGNWRGSYGWQGKDTRHDVIVRRNESHPGPPSRRVPGVASWRPCGPPTAAVQMLTRCRATCRSATTNVG